MTRSSARTILGSASIVASLAVFAFILFAQLRTPTRRVMTSGASAAPVNNATLASNATLVAACQAACLVPRCSNQSAVTGIVQACTECGGGRALNGGACVAPSDCAAWPWCSTPEADQAMRVHNALVQAALDLVGGNVTRVSPVYPLTAVANMTASRNYSVLAAQGLAPAASIGLLNLFLVGKETLLSQGSRVGPTPFLDDQAGFWNASLAAYRINVPQAYTEYLRALKGAVCTRTWLEVPGSVCARPL